MKEIACQQPQLDNASQLVHVYDFYMFSDANFVASLKSICITMFRAPFEAAGRDIEVLTNTCKDIHIES